MLWRRPETKVDPLCAPNGISQIIFSPLAREAGCTLSQFALAWILREPNVASAIVGASRPEQLDENAAASDKQINAALFRRAEAIVAEIGDA
jgi:aryl-alcohol dehydrogenase-like predicted oxidoreductase